MHNFTKVCWLLFSVVLSVRSAWAFSSNVDIYVYNNDYLSHEVDIEYSLASGDTGYKYATVDAGSYYEHTFSVAALLIGGTDTFDVYIDYHDSSESVCHTTLTVQTNYFFTVFLTECSTSATDINESCSVEAKKSGTTCQLMFTISD